MLNFFLPDVASLMFLPALFQAHELGMSRDQVPIDIDAREFMAGYADDLRHGRREAMSRAGSQYSASRPQA